ncbi:hypothetical protein PHYBLDRAFT_166110 [Phycomyces blakesleeanus NRRL 1555(-)]|uniref:Endonuclease/exonuclease/phosphatase domain-containing protein n=1 Tax=Phycomyces blakesleeanus (strain ATCC 8743b / DSM 1359 / FGSC 10004 / NBRC 33097 / NRRL 1555) TaxID=763407 RepID=A0A167NKH2_PHYB8|nr:hypothetical protein PHYBLDRAFT_166110 [Phycomyces blakesleeanus NRRL 1555(-)]OAD76139.1 hypothetical protein PHYBLDRAFT_166110 [Phycomyces blakesleeanus NRRL 1555(-)]|eukprot:XP_018294179.1 hypothetical protein PHYBLDRAFT_166110 [Phycomyces blakesleeanus NRRL 1555(-)]
MPRHTVTPEERAERRRRYMREYQRNRRQSLQVETSETETQQRNSMSQAEYMREYRRNRLRTAEMEVIATVEAENINTSRAEYMREYRRRRQQITEIEVVETVEAENISNSRAEYMREYRHRCRLTAEIEVVQAEVVRTQVIQAEVVGTEVVETEAAETEEENHNSRAEYMREYRRSRQSRAIEENERVLISHNVQSLRAHINQITSDQVYLTSDIILCNETWTLPNNEEYDIPNFTMISRIDSHSTNARVSGSCCYIRSSLLPSTNNSNDDSLVYTTSSRMFIDEAGGSTSISLFILSSSLYCSIYVSPLCQLNTLTEALEFVVSHTYMHITIAGDFNVAFTKESIKKTTLLQFMNNRNMTTTLPNTIQSTTSQNTLIDNIFSTMPVLDSGRYISLTSYHSPLWAKFM